MRRLVYLLVLVLTACGEPSDPEIAIRERLEDAREAVEARDTGFFRDFVSKSYTDTRGGGQDEVINRVRGAFLRYPRIRVASTVEDIELVSGAAARVVLLSGATGDDGSPLAGLSADLFRFELELVQEDDGEWRLVNADWSSLKGRGGGS